MTEVSYSPDRHKVHVDAVMTQAFNALVEQGILPIEGDRMAFRDHMSALGKDPEHALTTRDIEGSNYTRSTSLRTLDHEGRPTNAIDLKEHRWSLSLTPLRPGQKLPPEKSRAVAQMMIHTKTLDEQSTQEITSTVEALDAAANDLKTKNPERVRDKIATLERERDTLQQRTVVTQTEIIFQRAHYELSQGSPDFRNIGGLVFTERIGGAIEVGLIESGQKNASRAMTSFTIDGEQREAVEAWLSAIVERTADPKKR